MDTIYYVILSCFIGVIVSLSAYIWNQQTKRINKLEGQIEPLNKIFPDIREIKTDMSWIKKKLFSDDK